VKNAKAMARAFVDNGYKIISGGTDNHLMLIDLRPKNITGQLAEEALGKAEITVNKNLVPFDDRKAMITSGMRVGTAAISTRGLLESDCEDIADWMNEILSDPENDKKIAAIKKKVKHKMKRFPLYPKLRV
jgi:glycine hydroxymethyltransferase